MKISISILLFLLLQLVSHAQQNPLEKAIIITQANETIKGKIHKISDEDISYSFNFINDDNNETSKYYPKDIKEIMFHDSIFFEPVIFRITEDKINHDTLIFAKVIAKGNVSLYYIDLPQYGPLDLNYNYAFIIKKDDKFYTLTHGKNINSNNYKKYIGILRYILQHDGIPMEAINRTKFTSRDLANLISKYNFLNGNSTNITTTTTVRKTQSKAFLCHQIKGGAYYALPFQYNSVSKLSNGLGWGIAYSLNVLWPNSSKKFYTAFEVGYFSVDWKDSVSISDYWVNRKEKYLLRGARVGILGSYKLSLKQTHPFIQAGAIVELSNKEMIFPSLSLGFGYKYNRIIGSLSYERPLSFSTKNFGYGSYFQLRLGFAFKETKQKKYDQ